ncbi:MAG: hypothetical protein LHW59_10275 [Candidatus Cloacimonetes bacterium]|nr:hypothetical protein [Candidatus Cloacimonadota bacterium]
MHTEQSPFGMVGIEEEERVRYTIQREHEEDDDFFPGNIKRGARKPVSKTARNISTNTVKPQSDPVTKARKELRQNKKKRQTKEESHQYVEEFDKMLEEMAKKGIYLPEVRKATAPTKKLQMTAHAHMDDQIQGYWERHRDKYLTSSKVAYRALYIGMVMMLREEQIMDGIDSDEMFHGLSVLIAENNVLHRRERYLILAKNEAKNLISALSHNVFSDALLYEKLENLKMPLLNQIDNENEKRMVEEMFDDMVEKEFNNFGAAARMKKYRISKASKIGIHEV